MKMFLCALSAVISICLIGSVVGCVSGQVTAQTISKMLKGSAQ